jgi:hypothetical protein
MIYKMKSKIFPETLENIIIPVVQKLNPQGAPESSSCIIRFCTVMINKYSVVATITIECTA